MVSPAEGQAVGLGAGAVVESDWAGTARAAARTERTVEYFISNKEAGMIAPRSGSSTVT